MPINSLATSRQGLSVDCSSRCSVVHGPVLIIEDDPVVASVLKEILVAFGFSVLTASSGETALALYNQSESEIFVVVMDYSISGMHAGQIVKRLRDMNSKVRVVLASGYPKKDICNDLNIEEVDAFISKPFPLQALVDTVYDLMSECMDLNQGQANKSNMPN